MTLPDDAARPAMESERYHRAARFLGIEAMLLDEGLFEEWLELLDEDLVYELPIREATGTRSEELSAAGFRIRDTKAMIRTRVRRLATLNAHAESPPSRTIRSVGSICLLPVSTEGIITVASSIILYRHRGTDTAGDTLHARRTDRLRIVGDGARLLARTVVLAESSLSAANLSIFL